MTLDPLHYPYPSQRMTTYARRGMVATSQPLAAQVGLDVLKRGGNAVDAAIATAAALTVLEPTSNGIGGDAFALVWTKGKLYGINGSGPTPMGLSREKLDGGLAEMPKFGLIPVTVPGAPATWAELSKRFGKLPFSALFDGAIDYAEFGYPVSPTLGKYWAGAFRAYSANVKGELFEPWFRTFAPNGRAPEIGTVWKSPDHARTLRQIAESGSRAFYEGELADQIEVFSKAHGGFLRKADLMSYAPEWVDPISVRYRGYDVWEIPPNGQGLVALMALNLLDDFSFSDKESVDTYHKQIEAIKLAFADGQRWITDPRHMQQSVASLLSGAYARLRRQEISDKAALPQPGNPTKGGTVYLATADGEGNMVSFIQSNYMGFGSGVVVPGTGIALQNRGHTFSLNPEDANVLEPGKKTYHTIIPGFLTQGNTPVGPFGVMGGFMQPQGHVQVVMNTVDFHLNPQAALDAPRWQWTEGKTVILEPHVPNHIAKALVRRGHDVKIAVDGGSFGRGQIIWKSDEGVLSGGTEARTDGHIAAY